MSAEFLPVILGNCHLLISDFLLLWNLEPPLFEKLGGSMYGLLTHLHFCFLNTFEAE